MSRLFSNYEKIYVNRTNTTGDNQIIVEGNLNPQVTEKIDLLDYCMGGH